MKTRISYRLHQMLAEWIAFRQTTVQHRTRHRLDKVLDPIHVPEGRQLVLLNIDEVIRIIRNSDEPEPALIARFKLSDRQAEDILEFRFGSWTGWKQTRSSRCSRTCASGRAGWRRSWAARRR